METVSNVSALETQNNVNGTSSQLGSALNFNRCMSVADISQGRPTQVLEDDKQINIRTSINSQHNQQPTVCFQALSGAHDHLRLDYATAAAVAAAAAYAAGTRPNSPTFILKQMQVLENPDHHHHLLVTGLHVLSNAALESTVRLDNNGLTSAAAHQNTQKRPTIITRPSGPNTLKHSITTGIILFK